MEILIAVIILAGGIGGVAYAVKSSKKEAALKGIKVARNEALVVQKELEDLLPIYFVEKVLNGYKDTLFGLSLKENGADADTLEQIAAEYRKVAGDTRLRTLADPSRSLKKKYYDPLDDSVIVDPVELTVNHPTQGKVVLTVNKRNACLYAKAGPKVFGKRYAMPDSYSRYLVRCDAYNNQIIDGFDIVDAIILYELLFSDGNEGYIGDCGYRGDGGLFGGAGASYYWGNPESTVAYGFEEYPDQVLEENANRLEDPPAFIEMTGESAVAAAVSAEAYDANAAAIQENLSSLQQEEVAVNPGYNQIADEPQAPFIADPFIDQAAQGNISSDQAVDTESNFVETQTGSAQSEEIQSYDSQSDISTSTQSDAPEISSDFSGTSY